MTLGSAVPVIWLKPQNFLMGHMTWPRPNQGRFIVRRLTCTFNLYIKFDVFAINNYEDA